MVSKNKARALSIYYYRDILSVSVSLTREKYMANTLCQELRIPITGLSDTKVKQFVTSALAEDAISGHKIQSGRATQASVVVFRVKRGQLSDEQYDRLVRQLRNRFDSRVRQLSMSAPTRDNGPRTIRRIPKQQRLHSVR
jgi:hypothetical protein